MDSWIDHDYQIERSPDREHILTCALVLSAAEISHLVVQDANNWLLMVQQNDREKASRELQAFFAENLNWPPRPSLADQDAAPVFQPPSLLVVGGLALLYSVTGPWSDQSIWFTQGAGDARAILQDHQWWRLITALTLHADLVHLLGNFFIGGFLLHFFCRLTGNGLALFTMLFTATLANLVNTWAHQDHHLFIGFSTAVFAVIGILSGLNFRTRKARRGYRLLTPLMAGVALLAMLGSSGERTDLGAHLFGLLCGVPVGVLLDHPFFKGMRQSLLLQLLFFALFLWAIIGSWLTALA
jgi:rhomboid protease GluP